MEITSENGAKSLFYAVEWLRRFFWYFTLKNGTKQALVPSFHFDKSIK